MEITDIKVFLAEGYRKPRTIRSMAITEDYSKLVAQFGNTELWDIPTGQFLGNLGWYPSQNLRFNSDGNVLIIGGDNNDYNGLRPLRLDVHSRIPIDYFPSMPFISGTSTLSAFSPDLKIYARTLYNKDLSRKPNEVIDFFDTATGEYIHSSLAINEKNITIQAMAFNYDGSKLAICVNEMGSMAPDLDGEVYLLDVGSGRLNMLGGEQSPKLSDWIKLFILHLPGKTTNRSIFTKRHRELRSVAFSPDGKILATGCSYGIIFLWDTSTKRMLYSLRYAEGGHKGSILSLKFSHDGRKLASSSGLIESEIKIWDVAYGELQKTIIVGSDTVLAGFSKHDLRLFSGSSDGTIRYWDVATGKELVRLMTFADDEWAGHHSRRLL